MVVLQRTWIEPIILTVFCVGATCSMKLIPPLPCTSVDFQLKDVRNCDPSNSDNKFRLEEIHVRRYNKTEYVINGKLCTDVRLEGDWTGCVNVYSHNEEDPSQPIPMGEWCTNSVCNDTLVKYQKNIQEFSQYVENISTYCPIEPGCYTVKDAPISPEEYGLMVPPGTYIARIQGYLNGEPLWCSNTEIVAAYPRNC